MNGSEVSSLGCFHKVVTRKNSKTCLMLQVMLLPIELAMLQPIIYPVFA